MFLFWVSACALVFCSQHCHSRHLTCFLVFDPEGIVASSSNVKTVKDKRSTNVPQTFRHLTGIKPKCLSLHSRICPFERDHVYLVQENRFWTKSKQSVLNRKNSISFPKRYRNVCPFVLALLIVREISETNLLIDGPVDETVSMYLFLIRRTWSRFNSA